MFARLYTGDDGRSHIEDLDLDAGPIKWLTEQPTASIAFRISEAGRFVDWHTAPRRQYMITLSGQVEIGLGDGTLRRFGPGDVMLAEDLTGEGHTTRVVSDGPRTAAVVPLD